jgi:hypothetical protein
MPSLFHHRVPEFNDWAEIFRRACLGFQTLNFFMYTAPAEESTSQLGRGISKQHRSHTAQVYGRGKIGLLSALTPPIHVLWKRTKMERRRQWQSRRGVQGSNNNDNDNESDNDDNNAPTPTHLPIFPMMTPLLLY